MQIPKKITVGRKTYAVIKVKKAKTKKWRGGGGRQGRGCDSRLAVEEREGGNPPLTSPRRLRRLAADVWCGDSGGVRLWCCFTNRANSSREAGPITCRLNFTQWPALGLFPCRW